MKKIILVIVALVLVSCNKQDVLLPQIDKTMVEKVDDLSPIYIFFKVEGKDTIADLNRKNAISSTNFIFNIDKRLPLKLVLPEVIKVQTKKASSMHSNKESENYYSYSDISKKNLAFVPFTNVIYKFEKPNSGVNLYFSQDKVFVDTREFDKAKAEEFIENMTVEELYKCNFCFDKNDSYENYIKNYIFVSTLEIKRTHFDEFIF